VHLREQFSCWPDLPGLRVDPDATLKLTLTFARSRHGHGR